jgi:neutral amino acid transport system ATP-binding protein
MTTLLQIQGLCSGYADVTILHGISLSVSAAEVVCVVGPNGAGKSTLLKSVMKLARVSAGEIRFAGEDLASRKTEDMIELGIAYVPQVRNVFASLTVRENLLLAAPPRVAVADVVAEAFSVFPELRPKEGVMAGALSGGERQMLAFARALARKPSLLLLDEPTAALSPRLAESVFERIAAISAAGTAILLIEQNAVSALRISHRGYLISNGQNEFDASGPDLLRDPRIGEVYLSGGTLSSQTT